MPGLKELHIWLDHGRYIPGDPMTVSNILKQVRMIRRVRDFKVNLVWTEQYAAEYDAEYYAQCDMQYGCDDAPFQLWTGPWPGPYGCSEAQPFSRPRCCLRKLPKFFGERL
jgi:hypothetical protein